MTSTAGRGTRTPALAILVNGASSSGKSTLCRALHDLGLLIPDRLFPISFVKMQKDADLSRLASRVPFDGRASWEYVDDSHAAGKHGGSPRTRVVFNSHGERLLAGLHRSWGAHLQLGTHLVIDHFLQDPEWYEDFMRVLKQSGARVFSVGVFCSLAELERRESTRADGKTEGRPLGLARRSDELCHAHPLVYDLTVQTDLERTAQSVERIIAALPA